MAFLQNKQCGAYKSHSYNLLDDIYLKYDQKHKKMNHERDFK